MARTSKFKRIINFIFFLAALATIAGFLRSYLHEEVKEETNISQPGTHNIIHTAPINQTGELNFANTGNGDMNVEVTKTGLPKPTYAVKILSENVLTEDGLYETRGIAIIRSSVPIPIIMFLKSPHIEDADIHRKGQRAYFRSVINNENGYGVNAENLMGECPFFFKSRKKIEDIKSIFQLARP